MRFENVIPQCQKDLAPVHMVSQYALASAWLMAPVYLVSLYALASVLLIAPVHLVSQYALASVCRPVYPYGFTVIPMDSDLKFRCYAGWVKNYGRCPIFPFPQFKLE